MKALILDSNADECADVIEHLRQAGYTSITVASVAQAREALEHQAFDVLLLEWTLPDGDGARLCNEIRERLGQGMLIMFVSSRDTPSRRVVALELGADDFLSKPCNPEELLARIEARLRRVQTGLQH
jgi:two-component system OmpR family response regulator